jgi:hypothetical protein
MHSNSSSSDGSEGTMSQSGSGSDSSEGEFEADDDVGAGQQKSSSRGGRQQQRQQKQQLRQKPPDVGDTATLDRGPGKAALEQQQQGRGSQYVTAAGLELLAGMGFTGMQAERALWVAQGNVQGAVEFCLRG